MPVKHNKTGMQQQKSFQNHAPLKACIFTDACNISFQEESKAEDNSFHIVAYSGEIIPDHWYWGNVAFDLQGVTFDKPKTPVLDYHINGNRLGFTTKQRIDKQIEVDGKFLSNAIAQGLKNDMQEGFPMQASVYIPPSSIEFVKEGATAQVNGKTLKGPGAIFRQAKIKDVTICTFGYDSYTLSTAFAEDGKQELQFNIINEKENKMAEEKEIKLTAETFAVEYPDIHQQITTAARTEGERSQKDLFAAICELAPDDPAFVVEQFKAGKSADEAKTALIAVLKDKAKNPPKKPDAAEQEFSDKQTQTTAKDKEEGKEGDGPKTFDEAVTLEMGKDTGNRGEAAKRAAATRMCVSKYPKLHNEMLKENTHAS